MNGVIPVSDSSQNPNLSNKVIDVLVRDIFQKNNINIEKAKRNISDEQKEMLRELVQDLSQQVDSFLKSEKNIEKSSESFQKTSAGTKKIRFKK
jgi:spore coat protein W